MPTLDDIVRGFDTVRGVGAAFVADVGASQAFELVDAERFVALHRYLPWWIESKVCGLADVPAETLFLLWQRRDGSYGAIAPLVADGRRATIESHEGGLRLALEGNLGESLPGAAFAVAGDPFVATEFCMAAAAKVLGTFKRRVEKPTPKWVEQLGWCTWDAFYGKVTADDVIAGLTTLHAAGVRPKFMILDDGWLDTRESLLCSFDANAKFPGGLAPLIERVKRDFGIERFGAWHSFQGYWSGVHPDSELGQRYRLIDAPVRHTRLGNEMKHHGERRVLVHPDDVGRFYDDWYAALKAQGVDMTKVDNQGSHDYFGGGEVNVYESARAYQQAMQAASIKYFDGELLHCMANSNEHALNCALTNVWRNSDDYFPRRNAFHGRHVYSNAANAVWTSTFALPDWDMFQTTRPGAMFHAAARAISGGPVYVSDKPGEHDAAILSRLMTSDGRILRSGSPATITRDRLFVDCNNEPRLLKVFTHKGRDGVLGLFHCQWQGDTADDATNQAASITDTWRVDDIENLGGEQFAAWHAIERKLFIIDRGVEETVTLPPLGAELIHLVPILQNVAPLGLTDKLNSSAAMTRIASRKCKLIDGGTVGWYAAKRPTQVLLDGVAVDFQYEQASGLLTLQADEGRPHESEVIL